MSFERIVEKDNLIMEVYRIIKEKDRGDIKVKKIYKLFEESKEFNRLLGFYKREGLM